VRTSPVLLVLAAAAALGACRRSAASADPDELTGEERAKLATLSPLGPPPADPTNAYADHPGAARLGQRLFFDADLSGPLLVDSALGRAGERGRVACHTCHDGPALDDQRPLPNHVSIGTRAGGRNSPPVLNSAHYAWTNWGGRFDSQWSLVLGAIENPEVMNGTRVAVIRTVYAKYRDDYDAVFPVPLDPALDPAAGSARFPADARPSAAGGAWEAMAEADRAIVDRAFADVGKAVAAYMRLLVAGDAPFDRFAAGDDGAIPPAARRGYRLFLRHCESCHGGPHFQDDAFHALGVAQFGPGVPEVDLGRFTDVVPLLASSFNTAGPHSDGPGRLGDLAQDPAQRGQFRTPTLRNVAVTAPYMHAGQLATLDAVVAFYNAGGGRVAGIVKSAQLVRLDLTAEEQADLVAFMESLTDTRVPPGLLVDTSR
jgi:cytochrome c peroxidase